MPPANDVELHELHELHELNGLHGLHGLHGPRRLDGANRRNR